MEGYIASIADKVMRLEFFAARFGINVDRVSWGILKSSNEDGLNSLYPVVSIKNSNLFIDILNDRLSPLVNIGGCKSFIANAHVSMTSSGYVFVSNQEYVDLTASEICDEYRCKIFTSDVDAEAYFYTLRSGV